MSCANCARTIEKGLAGVSGIESVRVFLGDESAEVRFDAAKVSPEQVIAKIQNLGFGARKSGERTDESTGTAEVVFTSLLAVPTAFLAMAGADSWPNRFTQMILSGLILMTTGRRFFQGAIRSLKVRSTNMDVLVSLGLGTSWTYSSLVLAFPSLGAGDGHGMVHFETTALLTLFILVGKRMESAARKSASDSLRSLTELQQGTARKLVEGGDTTVPVGDVRPGDLLRILPGERFPVDGTVVGGGSAVDESLLTGESMPVEKQAGSCVLSGTVNLTGELSMRVSRPGSESTLQGLIRAMRRAQGDKPPIQRFADRASDIFVPAVVSISVLTFLGWLVAGGGFHEALMRAVAVTVVACPCALGLATPTAIVVAGGIAMKRGLLVKKPSALEALGELKFLLFDKTGTLTLGSPSVRETFRPPSASPARDDMAARSLASRSIHPLSRGIVAFLGETTGNEGMELVSFEEKRGFGLTGGTADGRSWFLGSGVFLAENGIRPPKLPPGFKEKGLSPVFLATEKEVVLVFGLSDPVKPDSPGMVRALVDRGIKPVIVSGDREAAVAEVARQLEIHEFRSEVKPAGKVEIVREYLAQGPTGFVGDGINDAPALSTALVGIAIGSGAEAAREATDLVMVGKEMGLLPFGIDLARATISRIRQNLFWAVGYNLLALPLAAGILIPFFGPRAGLSPEIAGLAMALSSISVVLNSIALRRLFPVNDPEFSTRMK